MTTLRLNPTLFHHHRRRPSQAGQGDSRCRRRVSGWAPVRLPTFSARASCFCEPAPPRRRCPVEAQSGLAETAFVEAEAEGVLFKETFLLKRIQTMEGRVSVKLGRGKDGKKWELTVGCNLPGKWTLHWGVTYSDIGSEWDQPPPEMRPQRTIPIKDYAVETPLRISSPGLEGELLHKVQIDFSMDSSIAAIHFVLKEEETGCWYQHRGRDFKIPLPQSNEEDDRAVGGRKGFGIWLGALLSNILLKVDGPRTKDGDEIDGRKDSKHQNQSIEGFYEEYCIVKEKLVQNALSVFVRNSSEHHKDLVHIDTDLPGDVVVHWGISRHNDRKEWGIPPAPHPPGTKIFKKKALQTVLQQKENGGGSCGSFSLDEGLAGFLFVLKLNEYTWLRNMGSDFFIPLSGSCSEKTDKQDIVEGVHVDATDISAKTEESSQVVNQVTYTDGIINEIRNLVSDISSEISSRSKIKAVQEKILQEIEKLAAEAYSIFRGSSPTFVEESTSDAEAVIPPVQICSGTGSGYEILCQGFNWESHKSGRWYLELNEKATELSSLGFTIIWLPPPTESVSPEGYMPKDLYNLNSRYGNMDELKTLVKIFHDVGIKVLGDIVLNHRCAHFKNQNGVWNIFGGRLAWDDRAVVSDDPHFQGMGNRSSGDNFHAAPNIDHSQGFVRKDLKEWLGWLRKEIGYDGWRLDFVRGFWGGYVKDYMDATEPYFAVGEYWDSLSYTYGNLDRNQDAHRQRIIDWINATNGTAGAFDVTTKGILHAALEKCEYWRLSDDKGKPPGVVGWWPSRAVTFIENHDTGSTQGHWRFPSGKEMQGYAYILTHPGTPAVFYDHIFSHYHHELSQLISLRNRLKINCRSTVKIVKAERDVYAAEVDEKIVMKIGPVHYEPPSGSQKWILAAEGRDYKVWELSQ